MTATELTFPFWLIVSGDDSVIVIIDQAEYFLGYSGQELAAQFLFENDDKTLGTRLMTRHDLEALAADHEAIQRLAWNWLPAAKSLNYLPLSELQQPGTTDEEPAEIFPEHTTEAARNLERLQNRLIELSGQASQLQQEIDEQIEKTAKVIRGINSPMSRSTN